MVALTKLRGVKSVYRGNWEVKFDGWGILLCFTILEAIGLLAVLYRHLSMYKSATA